MKKGIFVLAVLLGMALQSNAQEKGQFWVGGSFGFSSTDREDVVKTNEYSVYPEFGYAFSNRWGVGLRLGYHQTKDKYDETYYGQLNKRESFSVSPFARYTCFTWKAFSVFVDGGLSYSRENTDNRETDYYLESKSNYYGLFLQPGFALRLSNCISLTGHLDFFNAGYRETDYDTGNTYSSYVDNKSYSATLNSPFNLNNFTVGFNFKF